MNSSARLSFPAWLAGVIVILSSAATTVEACDASRTPAARNALASRNPSYGAAVKRIPRAKFMARVKAVASDAPEPSVAGLWTTAFVIDQDQVVDSGFESFSMGNTHVLNDPSPILEGNVCLGVWQQIAPLTYVVTHPAYIYDDQGVNVVGMASINEKISLDPGGDSFTEDLVVIVTDLDGNVLETDTGTVLGTRVKPDPTVFDSNGSAQTRK